MTVNHTPTAALPFRGYPDNRFGLPWILESQVTSLQQVYAESVTRQTGTSMPYFSHRIKFADGSLDRAYNLGTVANVTNEEAGLRIVTVMNALQPVNPDLEKIAALRESVNNIRELLSAYQNLNEEITDRPDCAALRVAVNDTYNGISKKQHGINFKARGWLSSARGLLKAFDNRPDEAPAWVHEFLAAGGYAPNSYWALRDVRSGEPVFVKEADKNPAAINMYANIITRSVALYSDPLDPAKHLAVLNRLNAAIPVIRDRFSAYWQTGPHSPEVLTLQPLNQKIMDAVDKLEKTITRIYDKTDRVAELLSSSSQERAIFYRKQGMNSPSVGAQDALKQLKLAL